MKQLKNVLISIFVFLVLFFILLCLLRCCDSGTEEMPRPDPAPYYGDDRPSEAESRAQEIGHDGKLKITLLWDFLGDVDIHVREPNNFEIYFQQLHDSRTGGYLDVDNRLGGSQSAENVYWEAPLPGRYKVSVVYYGAVGGHTSGGPCTVVVKREINGEPKVEQFVVNVSRANPRREIPVTEFDVY